MGSMETNDGVYTYTSVVKIVTSKIKGKHIRRRYMAVNIFNTTEQVGFQLTCPDGQVNIWEKYHHFSDLSLISNVC